MTKTVAWTDVQTQIMVILDEELEQGTEFVITKDGLPVARIVPIDASFVHGVRPHDRT